MMNAHAVDHVIHAEVAVVDAVEIVEDNLLNLEFDKLDLKLKEYAKINHVPIIIDSGLALLESVIAISKPKKILEIGTAIGYSALRMNKVCNSDVYTIERNIDMYNEALKNVEQANKNAKIHLIFKDALEAFDEVKDNEFDLIFIDAAKAQYTKFFDLYTPLLSKNGIVVCDNMLFHGLVENDEAYESQSRAVRGLIRKLKSFHKALLENPNYKTSIFEIGDGVSISVKK